MPDIGSEYRLTVPRTARAYILDPTGDPKGTLFALHGYGQLARFFIRKFQAAADSGWRVVAPEGGHRFYLQGTEGRVGASWMTKEDRLADIDDHVRYLDLLRAETGAKNGTPEILLGFSQGVATAFRWAALGADGPASWQGMVAHSGVIPPDLPGGDGLLVDAPPLHVIVGREDPYITDVAAGFRKAEEEWKRSGGASEKIHLHTFEGGHSVHPSSVLHVLDGTRMNGDSPNLRS